MSDADSGDDERIEKTATGPVSAYKLDKIIHEMELVAADSLPKLDLDTVRIEEIEKLEGDMRRVTISGEKSKFCPTTDRSSKPKTEESE